MGSDPLQTMAEDEIFDMDGDLGTGGPVSEFVSPMKRQLNDIEREGADSDARRVSPKTNTIRTAGSGRPTRGVEKSSALAAQLHASLGGNENTASHLVTTGSNTGRKGVPAPLIHGKLTAARRLAQEDDGTDSSDDEALHQRLRDRQRMVRAQQQAAVNAGSTMMSASLPANIDRTRAKYFRSLNLLPPGAQEASKGGGETGPTHVSKPHIVGSMEGMAAGGHSTSQPISIQPMAMNDEDSDVENGTSVDPSFVPPHKLVTRGCFSVADVQVKPKKFGQL